MNNIVSSDKSNNISSKMLRSKMIQTRRGISYNNSNTYYYYNTILEGDEIQNKGLLLSLGKDNYERHLRRITNSAKHDLRVRTNLEIMYQSILSNLTIDEEKQLGIYIETEADIQDQLIVTNEGLLDNVAFIYTCKVITIGIYHNFVIRNYKITDTLTPGKKYVFDLQHASNLGFKLSFSLQKYVYKDIDGLNYIGTPGMSGGFLVYTPPEHTDIYKIFLYDSLNKTRISFDLFGYIIPYFVIEVDYKNKSDVSEYAFIEPVTNEIICLPHETEIKMAENKGPNFFFEDVNDRFTMADNINDRYRLNRQYGLYYGTYYTTINTNTNPITLLNKGKEHLIDISGAKYETYYLKHLTTDGTLDGSYNFYYGDFTIQINGNFGNIGLFSHFYGFNRMESLFVFADKCMLNSYGSFDYQVITSGVIECLLPFSSVKITLINNLPYISFNGNDYDDTKIYGLCNGQYIIKNIPINNPIAFINKGKEDYFEYFGLTDYSLRRIGPDNNVYTYYYGAVTIRVYGDFGKISLYDYYNGYIGGKYLFQYTDICDYNIDWNYTGEYLTQPSTTEIIEYDLDYAFGIIELESYIYVDVSNDILLLTQEDISDGEVKYGINSGTYVFMNVPQSNPIAFLNNEIKEYFTYDGFFPYKTRSIGPDGNYYDFYYGNINVYVTGNFGTISFYTLNNGFMNGRRKIIYDFFGTPGQAIESYGTYNNYPTLLALNETITGKATFNISISIFLRVLPYSNDLIYFRFIGSDRNGKIDSEENNPSLLFFTGDTINFNFNYTNSQNTLGIYIYKSLLQDSQVITNNNNNTNTIITWTPTLPLSNYYFYRSSIDKDLVFNNINIQSNTTISLDASFNSITPSSNSIIDIEIQEIIFIFNETINITENKHIYIKNQLNEIEFTFTNNNLIKTSNNRVVLYTNFNTANRLRFSTTYSIVLEDELFYNIYLAPLEMTNIATYTTIPSHYPIIEYIYPESSYLDTRISVIDGSYVLTNILEQHPFAILNGSITGIDYNVVDDNAIIIYVGGGSFTSPYYTFTDETGTSLDILNGIFKFMRGRTYQFISNNISSLHPFKIVYNKGTTTSSFISGTGNSITIQMGQDDTESSYYQCANHSTMIGNISFLYRTIDEIEYNFYYGDIYLNITENFNIVSYYCYYHGYMGGENSLLYGTTNKMLSQDISNGVYFESVNGINKYRFDTIDYTIDSSINITDSVIFTFNEPVTVDDSITFLDISNLNTIDAIIEVSGNSVLFSSTEFEYSTQYRLILDAYKITDASNVTLIDTDNILTNYTFYTQHDQRPQITSIIPDYGAIDISGDTLITITFDKTITLESSGTIFIQDLTNGVFFDIINLDDINDLANINVNNNILTITPFETFVSGIQYALTIANDVIKDSDGRYFTGFTTTSDYNFTIA